MDAAGDRERPLGGAERVRAARGASPASMTGPSGMGADRTSSWSREALPQMPQDAVATKLRSATSAGSKGCDRRTSTSSSGTAWLAGSPCSIATISAGSSISPSEHRKPTARSASSPGVCIVMATSIGSWPGPATRMAIGSSPASRSSRVSTVPPRTTSTRARVAWRSREGSAEGSGVVMARMLPAPRRAPSWGSCQ